MTSEIKTIYFPTSKSDITQSSSSSISNKKMNMNHHTIRVTPQNPDSDNKSKKRQTIINNRYKFNNLSDDFQWNILQEIQKKMNELKVEDFESEVEVGVVEQTEETKESVKFILQEINKKIYGYKSQDHEKCILNPEKFVDLSFVIKKLIQCELCCFYCRNPTLLLYEYVREPRQWTLERIDNAFGHNKDNIEIACLSCNLRRRTMYHERYVFTKQMRITKQKEEEEEEEEYEEEENLIEEIIDVVDIEDENYK